MTLIKEDDIKISASKAADLAYNKVIINSVKRELYKQYGIELWKQIRRGSTNESQTKSEDELNLELVNAIAMDKARPKLRGY